jgi:hypothetical protein
MIQIKQPTFVFSPDGGAKVYEDDVLIGEIRREGLGWRSTRFSGHYFPFSSYLKSYRNAVEIFGH